MNIKSDVIAGVGTEFLIRTDTPTFHGYAAPFHITTDTNTRLRDVGLEAAKAASMSILNLEVETKEDSSGNPAHFFKYTIQNIEPFDGKKRLRLLQQLRDNLLKQGDGLYPFVEINVR
jgi:hypothetical protein